MKKNKIQADNVEQLMEIVRSLQRGEEPTQESIRKSAERVPKADAPMSNLKEDQELENSADELSENESDWDDWEAQESMDQSAEDSEAPHQGARKQNAQGRKAGTHKVQKQKERKQTQQEKTAGSAFDEDGFEEDDEFARLLREDDGPVFGRSGKSAVSGALQKASGLFAGLKERFAQTGTAKAGSRKASEEEADKEAVAWENEESEAADPHTKRRGDIDTEEREAADLRTKHRGDIDTEEGEAADPRTKRRGDIDTEEGEAADPGTKHRGDIDTEESEAADPRRGGWFSKKREAAADEDWSESSFSEHAQDARGSRPSLLSRDSIFSSEDDEEDRAEFFRRKREAAKAARLAAAEARQQKENARQEAEAAEYASGERAASSNVSGQAAAEAGHRDAAAEAPAKSASALDSGMSASDAVSESEVELPEADFAFESGASDASSESQAETEDTEFESRPEPAGSEPNGSEAPPKKKRRRKTAAEKEEEIRKGFAMERRTLSDYAGAAKDAVRDLLEEIRQRGISRREAVMIGTAAVFLVLICMLVWNMISNSIETKQKSQHVTADDGLRVTVESEPENWARTWPVKLRFQTSGAKIQEVRIGDAVYQPDEKGYLTVETGEWLLEAVVETDQGSRNARIEIPKLDNVAPLVYTKKDGGQIELSAADSRSPVTGIYYAAYRRTELNEIPLYQKYSEPFAYTEGMTYSFYAEDAAGNRSTPVMTTMETAESLSLSKETMSLYPGESGELLAQAVPEGAFLGSLQFESMNPELLSVDYTGRVTALAEGTGAVRVSADGVEDAVCTVEIADVRTMTVSTVGDCTLGTDESFNTNMNFNAFDTVNGHSYFFENVRSILDSDDATFANFEGTLTTSTARENKQYAFKGDPSYAEILKDGSIDVVTLANNHSSDYGAQSLTDTQAALEGAGIDYCKGDEIAVKDVNGIRTAFIGIYVLNDGMARQQQVQDTIAAAQAQGAQVIIVGFHWGSEKASQPDETQVALAHTAIDSGADLVVGHHPHVLQGIEQYKGKYIAYSLGNFCFGGNNAPSDMDTMIFQQTFKVTQEGAQEAGTATVIPCSISSTSGYNNYQPTPAEGEAGASIIARLNELSAAYGVTVASDGTVSASDGTASASDGTAPVSDGTASASDGTAPVSDGTASASGGMVSASDGTASVQAEGTAAEGSAAAGQQTEKEN